MMSRAIKAGVVVVLGVGATAAFVVLGIMVVQGKRRPAVSAEYVALGSSFAAGLGLGPRAPGSPYACLRSINGYPQELARLTGFSLEDMTCSGATTSNILRGGQFFQGPQLDAVGPSTKLVTLTTGGNDIRYVGDLVMISTRNRLGGLGSALKRLSKAIKGPDERPFAAFRETLTATIQEIRRRAPGAQVVVVTYPTILPAKGTCAALGLDAQEAETMRHVGDRLAELTRTSAQQAGASVVDMSTPSVEHEACSIEPWVNGARPATGAAFHPNRAGANATAQAVHAALTGSHPAP